MRYPLQFSAISPFHAATFFVRILAAPSVWKSLSSICIYPIHMRVTESVETSPFSKIQPPIPVPIVSITAPYFLRRSALYSASPAQFTSFSTSHGIPNRSSTVFLMPFRYNSGSAVPNRRFHLSQCQTIPAVEIHTPASASSFNASTIPMTLSRIAGPPFCASVFISFFNNNFCIFDHNTIFDCCAADVNTNIFFHLCFASFIFLHYTRSARKGQTVLLWFASTFSD